MAPPHFRQAEFEKPSPLLFEKGPDPFAALKAEESQGRWAQDFILAKKFQAISDSAESRHYFRSASLLAPQDADWALCLDYQLLLLEMLASQHTAVIQLFERSKPLQQLYAAQGAVHREVYQDLLVILADSYLRVARTDRLEEVLSLMPQSGAATMRVYADLTNRKEPANAPEAVKEALASYHAEKFNPGRAALLNAVLPGAGYYYIGQHSSALTSFILNAATTAAAVYFFERSNWGAGVLFATMECGWYFGGISGAYDEAYYFNNRLWEKKLSPVINEGKFAPALQLNFTF